MFDAFLIAAVAAIFVTIITSSRRLRGPIVHPIPLREREDSRSPAGASDLAIPVPRAAGVRIPLVGGFRHAALSLRGVRVPGQLVDAVLSPIGRFALQRRHAIGLALAVAVSAVVWFVWPTQYRTLPLRASGARIGKSFDVVALRQQRVTGRVDALVSGGGWVCVAGC